ncbi:MAG: exodeoxyribonuclease VII small subunit [Candidatus Bipolaricaulota bacterium]|nr:exodeoxyribonuclease VII small subunit [Candidatus Bipolaricaulota bacterium]MDW8030487.1 exodeoxyribonuclease VII small subunit [Candidatus Bipolaricaulota bacterium]
MEQHPLKIEPALARLEEIVRQLENEQISLEESLELFEEGVKLADSIQKRLSEAQLRVKKVLEEAENFKVEDFGE